MICPTCRHDNPPGTRFCSACQAFLAWDPAPESAPNPPPDQDSHHRPAPQEYGPPPAQPPETAPLPEPEPPPETAPLPEPAPPPRPPAQGFGPTPQRYEPVPQPPPLPPPDPRTGPVVPDAAAARRPGERTDRPQPVTGFFDVGTEQPAAEPARTPDRPCPRCRAANPSDRRLCGRCGAVLDPDAPATPASAPVPEARLPWWRRMLRRPERAVAAGYRPPGRTRRRLRPRVVWPVVIVVLALVGWLVRGQLSDLVSNIQDRSAKPAPLHPNTATASTASTAHPAGMAFDGYANRYWAPAAPGAGAGQYVEAGFPHAVRLVTILITPGCSADDGTFLTQARPSRITLTFYGTAGHPTTRTVTLRDQAGPQTFEVHVADVTRVRLTTDASYGATGGRRLAIAEVEFFGRQ